MKLSSVLATLASFSLVDPALSQITIDSTLNASLTFGNPGAAGEQVVASFDASMSDKLIVVVSTEHSFGINAAFSIDGAEYNGRTMIEAVEENSVPGASALYYLDDPGPAGEIRLYMGMKNGGLVTIYAVSGTASGVASIGQSTTDSVALTTTAAGSLVVAGILDGGQATNGNGAGAPLSLSPLNQIHSDVWGGNIWGGHGSGYAIQQTPGPVTAGFLTQGPVRLRTVGAVFRPEGGIGTSYCMANPNSTGSVGSLTANGSNLVLDNNLTLTAADLPTASFGYFITSQTQGFSANPGGSSGNLCLGGSIGRYLGPGQIQNTGTSGSFDLVLDLTQTPTPGGLVPISAGETWNFQTWHRDSNMGVATSNFTHGLEVVFF